nr:PEP-CTERM sorting domain-containing protein [uncultured Roseateles sp.]
MKISNLISAVSLAVLSLAAAGPASAAASYTLTDLGTLGVSGSAGTYSKAFGINAAGQIVGASGTGGAKPRELGFVWSAGSMTALPSLDANGVYGSIAYGINAGGTVVGSGYTTDGAAYHGIRWQAALPADLGQGGAFSAAAAINTAGTVVGSDNNQATQWKNGVKTTLTGLGGSNSNAYGINDLGQVAGESLLAGNLASHAVLWTNGVASDLGTLAGGSYSAASGLNALGHAVGYGDKNNDQNYTVAVLWKNGQAIDLGTLGGSASSALAINSADQIVGSAWTSGNTFEHATLWSGNSLLDLNTAVAGGLGSFAYLESATALNDAGQIVGYGRLANGSTRAFLLTPVPEPETYALMLAGLGLLSLVARRRRG